MAQPRQPNDEAIPVSLTVSVAPVGSDEGSSLSTRGIDTVVLPVRLHLTLTPALDALLRARTS